MEMQQFVVLLSDEADMPVACTSQAPIVSWNCLQSNSNLVQFFFG
jgi:hypothetical protein